MLICHNDSIYFHGKIGVIIITKPITILSNRSLKKIM